MGKVVIVNYFDTYEDRIDLLHDFFKKTGHDVTIIQSDFRHFKKIHRTDKKESFKFIKSKPYYKNMSIARLSSHYIFAKHAFKVVEEINPDLLYVIIPPNSLARFAAQYKKRNSNVKLIFDLIDLWPETMPLGKVKNIPPFTFWRLLRDNSLDYADLVITECNLYGEVLQKILKRIKHKTLYLAKSDIEVNSVPAIESNEVHLCYLGSINNIIDIPKIKAILKEISQLKSITLHIIGDGETKEVLINEVQSTGTTVKYHGKIYDPQEKQDIFDKCHFGLNIMKDTVCVGLTMKSIDYIQHGLPIINNIKADTLNIVENYNIGINVTDVNVVEVANRIAKADMEDLLAMRENSLKVFEEFFSKKAFDENMHQLFKEL